MSGVRSRWVWPLAAGAWAAALSALWQRPGVVLSPDGWAYWEGSTSMLAGLGFTYVGGQPIVLWPPGFPALLALVQLLGGERAGALALAQAALLGVAAALWIVLLDRMERSEAPGADREPGIVRRLALLAALPALLAFGQRELGSESLQAALVAGALLVVVAPRFERAPRTRVALLALLVAALLLTRNAALALLPGFVLFAAATASPEERVRRSVQAIASCGVGGVIWTGVRFALGQAGSHPIALPEPARLGEIASGIAQRLAALAGPRSFGLGWIALAALALLALAAARARGRTAATSGAAALALFGATALIASALLVAIASPLEDRFDRFALVAAPLLVALPLLASGPATARPIRTLALALLAATALVAASRTFYWGRRALAAAPGSEGLGWNACLARPEAQPSSPCIAPPDFGWIDRAWEERPR